MEVIKRQLRRLYIFWGLKNLSIAQAAWVLLLVTRGFSLVQVGIAETVFHIVSLSAEIPSGMFADVVGRKRSLIAASIMGAVSCALLAFWDSFAGVCVAMAANALSYNLCSGTDSALAYDTLKEYGREDMYDGYASRITVIYRITDGIGTLAVGIAVMLGNVTAQLIGIGFELARLIIACSLHENRVISENTKGLSERVREVYSGSLSFLRGNGRVARLIIRNSLVGAVDILLLFFLQAKLPMTGIAEWSLGPLLFIMSMGGVVGAWVSERVKGWRFGHIFALCMVLVSIGFVSEFSGVAWIMTLGGFVAAFADDLIQVRADVELNSMVPSEQRATLVSLDSLCFSVVMIVMSPLAGWLFSL